MDLDEKNRRIFVADIYELELFCVELFNVTRLNYG